MSTGTIRAKNPEVLQANAESSTNAIPIAVLRAARAWPGSVGPAAPVRFFMCPR
jgi:hypothetical protein